MKMMALVQGVLPHDLHLVLPAVPRRLARCRLPRATVRHEARIPSRIVPTSGRASAATLSGAYPITIPTKDVGNRIHTAGQYMAKWWSYTV